MSFRSSIAPSPASLALLTALALAAGGPQALAATPPAPGPGNPAAAVQPGSTLVVTDRDNGASVVMRQNETLWVVLSSNGGTGYSWDIERLDANRIVSLGQASRPSPGTALPNGRALPMAGAPQQISYLFRMARPGSSELVLRLWRPWEGAASAVERFRLRLVTVLP